MRNLAIGTVACLGLLLTACTNTDDPQLATCQSVTKHLTNNTIASWDNISQKDSTKIRNINIDFSHANDSKGKVVCVFPIQENGTVDSAPTSVVLNGTKVGTKELVTAGAKATKELLAGTAANTVAKSKELATEASHMASDAAEKARVVAGEASQIAGEAADKARVVAGEASQIAGEAAGKARVVAGEVADKARDAAIDATKALQQKLEN